MASLTLQLMVMASKDCKEVNVRSVEVNTDNDHAKQVRCATVGSGLLRATLDEQFGAIVSRMDIEQGLPSQRVFAVLPVRAEDGSESIVIGTNRGITRYEPG